MNVQYRRYVIILHSGILIRDSIHVGIAVALFYLRRFQFLRRAQVIQLGFQVEVHGTVVVFIHAGVICRCFRFNFRRFLGQNLCCRYFLRCGLYRSCFYFYCRFLRCFFRRFAALLLQQHLQLLLKGCDFIIHRFLLVGAWCFRSLGRLSGRRGFFYRGLLFRSVVKREILIIVIQIIRFLDSCRARSSSLWNVIQIFVKSGIGIFHVGLFFCRFFRSQGVAEQIDSRCDILFLGFIVQFGRIQLHVILPEEEIIVGTFFRRLHCRFLFRLLLIFICQVVQPDVVIFIFHRRCIHAGKRIFVVVENGVPVCFFRGLRRFVFEDIGSAAEDGFQIILLRCALLLGLHAAENTVKLLLGVLDKVLRLFRSHFLLPSFFSLRTNFCQLFLESRRAIPLVHLRDDVVLQIRVSLGVLSLIFRKNGLSPFRICGVFKGICRDILSQVLVFRPLLFIFFLLQDIDEIHGAAAVSGRFFLSEKFFF